MKHTFKILLFMLFHFLLVVFPSSVTAGDSPVSLAVLPFENMNGNPAQDYLKGIIAYILIEDLSGSEVLTIVERDILETVVKEQNLQFTGLMDEAGAIETGQLLGASFMLKGSYVFLGQDIFINITLIDVATGTSRTFSERGYQENTVHALSEKLLKHMTGSDFSLQIPAGERTILAWEQQEPGIIELFSYIIDARVFIDEKFVGYTTGDSTVPLIMEVSPGRHTIRVHLTKNFGVLALPEVTFHDWEEHFELIPGDRMVLEDRTHHFNDLLYDIKQLLRKSIKIDIGSGEEKQIDHSIDFIDREGMEVKLELSIKYKEIDAPSHGGSAEVSFVYQDKDYNFLYFAPNGKDIDFSEEIGKIRLDIDLECNSSYKYEMDYSIWRTDVWQGMHRE
ncbi:MAG: CsgG/HfaB family protein [Spirochaetota bacterium]|nr:CsgG/HfaB family protein [Spirochaetota bacterium]